MYIVEIILQASRNQSSITANFTSVQKYFTFNHETIIHLVSGLGIIDTLKIYVLKN